MIEDKSYAALYLYNAVIEYIYFLIILIQDRGPNNLNNVAKHVKLFKKDVYTFIQIFKGSTLTEKISQMLCSTTSIFEIKDNTLHLATSHASCIQIIYEDLLVSKVADLILRGIFTIQDICRNLNLSSVIHINEDILISLLKHNPHFYLSSDSSVILVQFHGLVGVESHAYQTTVEYFQSYLQNIKSLTYNEIKLHSICVPSCAVRNSLLVFCILHVSILFKCKNNEVSLCKKRKTHHIQVLNIDKLASKISSDSLPIGKLVQELNGPTIYSWLGEISSLTSNAGLLHCVINFTNGHQGIFLIYFYKTALKYVCEVEDLRHFFNVRDIVEFDAEFCGKIIRKDTVWQATRIKVVKHLFKENKHVLDPNTDTYRENINLNHHKLKSVLKDCTKNNCLVKYIVFEEDTSTKNECLLSERDTSNNNRSLNILSLSDAKEENISKESQTLDVLHVNSSKISDYCCVQDINKIELDNNQLLNTSCSDNTVDIINKAKISNCQYESISNVQVQNVYDKINGPSNGIIKQSIITQEINEKLPTKCIKEDSEQNLVSDHYDTRNYTILSYVKGPRINSIELPSLVPNIFTDSSFILGEITFMSTNNGVAQSLQKNKSHEIFFEKNNIFQNGATKALMKGNQVLLFVPYADLEDYVLIATLVYPLTCEEKLVIQEKDLSAKDFVIDYYFPKVEKKISKSDFCCCDLFKSLSAYTQSDQNLKNRSETLLKCSQIVEYLRNFFQFNDKTHRNLLSLVNLVYAQNLVDKYPRLFKYPSFSRSLSWIKLSKNFSSKYTQRKKNMNIYKGNAKKYKKFQSLPKLKKEDCNNDTISTYVNEKNIPKIVLKPSSIEENYSVDDNCNIIELTKSDQKLTTANSLMKQSYIDIACDGKSSSSSFASCLDDSFNELSDDVFYSCESDSDSRLVSCKQPSLESNNLCESDKNPNSSNVVSEICNVVSKKKFPLIDAEDLNEVECNGISDKMSLNYKAACSILKLRNVPLFKRKRNKCKVILPSENMFCKSCHQLPIEMTAEISILKESTLYCRPKQIAKTIANHQNFTLAFPKSLIPVEKSEKIKLNAIIKATIIPHSLMNFSRVLYIDFI